MSLHKALGAFKKILLWAALCSMQACANRSVLSGGPVDKNPPKLISSVPDSAQRNFQGKQLRFQFNEFIELKNGGRDIQFSPPIKGNAQFTLRGKSIRIALDSLLDPNTTYTLRFGQSVVDITEGNAYAPTRPFVFSTGPDLDSIQFSGRIIDAFTLEPIEGFTAMLYPADNDSLPFIAQPRYFAKTEKDGNFSLHHIKAGTYRFFAQADEDGNLIHNRATDKLAFIALPLTIAADSTWAIPIKAFTQQADKQKIIRKTLDAQGRLTLKNAKNMEGARLSLWPENTEIPYQWWPENDSLLAFVSLPKGDSLKILYKQGDFSDTLFFNLRAIRSASGKRGAAVSVDTSFAYQWKLNGKKLLTTDTLAIAFPLPVTLQAAPLALKASANDKEIAVQTRWNTLRTQMQIIAPWQVGKVYDVQILPNQMSNPKGKTNDTLKLSFQLFDEQELGNLLVKFNWQPEANVAHILQLLDGQSKVLRSLSWKGGEMQIFGLLPGQLKLRIIKDSNSNGRWDTGDYFQARMPEEVYYYPGSINIRAGWDVDVLWKSATP